MVTTQKKKNPPDNTHSFSEHSMWVCVCAHSQTHTLLWHLKRPASWHSPLALRNQATAQEGLPGVMPSKLPWSLSLAGSLLPRPTSCMSVCVPVSFTPQPLTPRLNSSAIVSYSQYYCGPLLPAFVHECVIKTHTYTQRNRVGCDITSTRYQRSAGRHQKG